MRPETLEHLKSNQEHGDRHRAVGVRRALRRSLHDHLLNLLQLRVVVEEEVALVQLGDGVVVEIEEVGGGDIEAVLSRLRHQRLQILLMALAPGDHVNGRILHITSPKRSDFHNGSYITRVLGHLEFAVIVAPFRRLHHNVAQNILQRGIKAVSNFRDLQLLSVTKVMQLRVYGVEH